MTTADLDERAGLITDEWNGIFALYEAFYIHSIEYSADRSIEAFERYDAMRASGASGPDQVSAIHEALGHAASLSRFFWPSGAGPRARPALRDLKDARARKLRQAFGSEDHSPLKDRSLRDALEHFDERIDLYLLTSDAGTYMPVPRIGDSTELPNGREHVFKLVDPDRQRFVILDKKFNFGEVRDEVTRILRLARQMRENGARLRPQP